MLEKFPKESFERKEVVGRVGFSEDQGLRKEMQDAHVIELALSGDPAKKFFGIYDGHGEGRDGADLAAQKLHTFFQAALEAGVEPKEAIRRAFVLTDKEIEDLEKSHKDPDVAFGTTALIAFFDGQKLLIANAGDARAVLVREEDFERLSKDHKPYVPSEKERIEKAGGKIIQRGSTYKIIGERTYIAPSRALGDGDFDNAIVSPEPYVREIEIGPKDKKLVMACDGLWDVMTDTMVAEEVRKIADPQEVSKKLVEEALARKSRDNVSVLVINLNEQGGEA